MKTNIRYFVLCMAALAFTAGYLSAQKMVALDIGSYEGYGTLKLNSGEEINDTLFFGFAGKGKVGVVKNDLDNPLHKSDKYSPNEVAYFTIGDTTFAPVKTGQALTGEFMIRLTPQDYKIQLYKKYEQNEQKKVVAKYFVLFPEAKKAKDIVNDITLMPFAKKVSKQVQDCPDLAGKIGNKEEPYKMPMLSNEKTFIAMYMKIADAYQECK